MALLVYDEAKMSQKLIILPYKVQPQLHNGTPQHVEFHKLDSHNHLNNRIVCCFLHMKVDQNQVLLVAWVGGLVSGGACHKVVLGQGCTLLCVGDDIYVHLLVSDGKLASLGGDRVVWVYCDRHCL